MGSRNLCIQYDPEPRKRRAGSLHQRDPSQCEALFVDRTENSEQFEMDLASGKVRHCLRSNQGGELPVGSAKR